MPKISRSAFCQLAKKLGAVKFREYTASIPKQKGHYIVTVATFVDAVSKGPDVEVSYYQGKVHATVRYPMSTSSVASSNELAQLKSAADKATELMKAMEAILI